MLANRSATINIGNLSDSALVGELMPAVQKRKTAVPGESCRLDGADVSSSV